MAAKRMFSKSITNSSLFLMMPQSSQNLYFHLGMNADDDGFCEHFTIMRMTESKPDDLKILQAKHFVHVFDDKVLVILDWKENNLIRSDRYTPSKYLEIYKEELKSLNSGIPVVIPTVDLGKDRLGKDRLGKDKKNKIDYEESFNIFYELYKHPVNKMKSFAEWKKIGIELHQTIYNHVREYRERGQGVEFPLNPNNYLKNKRWEEGIIENFKDSKKLKPEDRTEAINNGVDERLGHLVRV